MQLVSQARKELEEDVERRYWEGLVVGLNCIHSKLQRKPRRFRTGHMLHPAGILSAYRDGDVSFKQAIRELEQWKKR